MFNRSKCMIAIYQSDRGISLSKIIKLPREEYHVAVFSFHPLRMAISTHSDLNNSMDEEIISALLRMKSQYQLKKARVIISLSEPFALVQPVDLSNLKSPAEQEIYVQAHASKLLQLPPHAVAFDWYNKKNDINKNTYSSLPGSRANSTAQTFLVAASKACINNRVHILKTAGFIPYIVDVTNFVLPWFINFLNLSSEKNYKNENNFYFAMMEEIIQRFNVSSLNLSNARTNQEDFVYAVALAMRGLHASTIY